MRPIKFRAEKRNGKIIYGDLLHGLKGAALIWNADDGCAHYVKPESVKELIGYDDCGKEIYEGDVIENTAQSPLGFPIGLSLSAELVVVLVDKFGKHYYAPKKFRWLVGSDKEYFP